MDDSLFEAILPNTRLASTKVLSISELNTLVEHLLDDAFPQSWVSGEISNFTRATSGHWYFTLKDSRAQVRAVMFRGKAQYVPFMPREGDHVEVLAKASLYTPRGDFQLRVDSMRRAGAGTLFEAFLKLKAKLENEGLFSQENKHLIPTFARTIGIITSPQAAALRDVLTTLARRSPYAQCILYPTAVQGQTAATQIIQAIETATRRKECDVLLLCRGGGSIEDLWCFNDELLARCIAQCPLPIISGVGHETDFTIADFVSDLRAPTPTAAAELATISQQDLLIQLQGKYTRLQHAMTRYTQNLAQHVDTLARHLVSPKTLAQQLHDRLNNLIQRQFMAVKRLSTEPQYELSQLKSRLTQAKPAFNHEKMQLQSLTSRLTHAKEALLVNRQNRLSAAQAQLDLLSPSRTLERGYAIVRDEKNKILRSTQYLASGKTINIKLATGEADIQIDSVSHVSQETKI